MEADILFVSASVQKDMSEQPDRLYGHRDRHAQVVFIKRSITQRNMIK